MTASKAKAYDSGLDRWQEQSRLEAQYGIVAGCDEAGRGPLCGPVVCAAVVLRPGWKSMELRDSKKISAKKREALALEIRSEALHYSVEILSAAEIDQWNILGASLEGMARCLDHLGLSPHYVAIDGNHLLRRYQGYQEAWIKGDDRLACIAAASILAKTTRDAWMLDYDQKFPGYGFAKNMGYPTAQHLKALNELGPTPEHRLSFKPLSQMEFNLG